MREFLNGQALLLHDGRARTVDEAILLHGGEAQRARDAFAALNAAQRRALLDFVEEVAFDRLGVFTYSREDGTPAAALPGAVPAEVMAERAQLVQEAQDRLAWPRQQALLGTRQTVLVDGPSADPAFPFEGRLAGQAPEIDGVVLLRDRALTPGRFAEVRIAEVDGYELVGA